MLREFGPEIRQLYSYALLNGLISLSLPLGLQAVIQFLMTGQLSTSVYVLVFLVVGGLIFSGWMNIMQLITSEHIRKHIVVRGAFDFIHRLPRLQLEKIAKKHVPELMNRFFDIISIEKGMQKLLMDFSTATLQLLLGLILLALYHPVFIVLAIVILILIYTVIRFTGERGLKLSLDASRHKYDLVFRMEVMAGLLNTLKRHAPIKSMYRSSFPGSLTTVTKWVSFFSTCSSLDSSSWIFLSLDLSSFNCHISTRF